jgi:hypothetical protein
MAKINEQKITIKLSQLVRDNDDEQHIISDENLIALIEAIQSMAGPNVLIELE